MPFSWAIWTQPPYVFGYVVLAEVATIVATVMLALRTTVRGRDLALFGVLILLGIGQAEIGRQTERLRRQLTDTPHINLTSVWTFAGVLLLPPPLVAGLVTILYLQLSIRSWYGLREVTPWRAIMNTSFVIITCYVSRGVLELVGVHDIRYAEQHAVSGTVAIVLAAAAYFVVGAVLVFPSIWARTHSRQDLVGTWSDNFLEVATLCLGAVAAVILAALPVLAIAILPPLVILHRGVLVRQLEVAATIDDKTGVLNAASWHYVANRELAKVLAQPEGGVLSVLMIDLDRFKRINDRHGHLTGDQVLKSVAACITDEVREYDSVGRFGGEEFVVLLPRASEVEACKIAERIRQAVTAVEAAVSHAETPTLIEDLSVSIGVATYPSGGTTLATLMHSADTALYRAKHDGRNRVVTFPVAA